MVLGGVLVWLRGRVLQTGPSQTVVFQDVDGMKEGAPVQLMGIRVGFVETVKPKVSEGHYGVSVKFTLNNDEVELPKGSLLSIQQSGLIGEKFLEVTPPALQQITLNLTQAEARELKAKTLSLSGFQPVKMQFQGGVYLTVGQVERLEWQALNPAHATKKQPLKLFYRLTRPGVWQVPPSPQFSWQVAAAPQPQTVSWLLGSSQPGYTFPPLPDSRLVYSVETPMRLREFLEVQIASAEALKETNDKINRLLSEATIKDIEQTLVNVRVVSGQASSLLTVADSLFRSVGSDLRILVRSSQSLTTQLNVLGKSLNQVLGDKTFQAELRDTMQHLQSATASLDELMQDPATKDLFVSLGQTSKSLTQTSDVARQTLQNPVLQQRLQTSVTLLNDSLERLSSLLGQVDTLTRQDDETLKGIVQDTRATTENLRKFSKRLNGHFVLWKLLF